VRTSREIEAVALKARKEIGLSLCLNETLLRKNLEDRGYFLFYYPFGESGISGALFSSVHARILVVNSSQSIGSQNFTVAHELGHIYLHNTDSLVEISGDESSTKEREADSFASMFLMPVNDVSSMIQTNGGIEFDAVEVMEMSQMFRMSYKATLKRLTEVFGRKAIPLTLWDKKPLQLAEMLNMDKKTKKKANIKISGMSCASCALNVEKSLEKMEGVGEAHVNLGTEEATVEYDPEKLGLNQLEDAVEDAGYGVVNEKVTIKVGGMSCAMCVKAIEDVLGKLDGVSSANVNLASEKAYVTYNPRMVTVADMRDAINDLGYQYLGVEGEETLI